MTEYSALENVATISLVLGLILASLIDFRTRKIPNALVLVMLILGTTVQSFATGISGLIDSISGVSVGLALLFPLFYFGGIGAGDVKLMAAAGAFMNGPMTLISILFAVHFATFIGIALLILGGGFIPYMSRYWLMLKAGFYTGKVIYIPPEDGEVAKQKFPCAIAIALGCISVLILQPSLNLM